MFRSGEMFVKRMCAWRTESLRKMPINADFSLSTQESVEW